MLKSLSDPAESIHIEFDDNNILSSLFGINDDSNIRILERINEVKD